MRPRTNNILASVLIVILVNNTYNNPLCILSDRLIHYSDSLLWMASLSEWISEKNHLLHSNFDLLMNQIFQKIILGPFWGSKPLHCVFHWIDQVLNPDLLHVENCEKFAYSQVPNKRVYSFIPNERVGLLFWGNFIGLNKWVGWKMC